MIPAMVTKSDKADWGVRIVLAFSMLLASLGTSIANIALPTLVEAFSAPFFLVQGVVVAYLGALTITTVVAGRLGDCYGLKRMHLAGLVTFAVASLLCGIAPNVWFLIGARAIQGIGAAFLMTLSMALMRETTGKERMGRAMGLLGTMSALGTALGPSMGGFIIPFAGWRAIFLVLAPLSGLALLLALSSLPRSERKWSGRPATILTMLDRKLAPTLVINVLVAAVMMTTLVVGPFYLGSAVGLGEAAVGLAMSIGPVVSIVCGLPSGRAVDAWGARATLVSGLAMMAVGALLLSVLPSLMGVTGYVFAIIVLTPGYQLFQSANNTAALADVPRDSRGLASGLLTLSRNVGLMVGASAMGAVFALGVGTDNFAHATSAAIGDGLRLTFVLAASMVVLAIMIVVWTPHRTNLQDAD